MMRRIDNILSDEGFCSELDKIGHYEADRIYCRHDLNHLLDVARIAYIHALEENSGLDKELIYAAALLHDIGRAAQYESGIPHDRAGAAIAADILAVCGFNEEEAEVILYAVTGHRGGAEASEVSANDAGAAKASEVPANSAGGAEASEVPTTDAGSGAKDFVDDKVVSETAFDVYKTDREALRRIIKLADDESRLCFKCRAWDSCKWNEARKNKELKI